MKKIFLIAAILFSFVASTFAQQHDGGPRKERIESLRVAYISEKLNLTPEEVQRFWPVYNQFRDQLKAIHKADKAKNNVNAETEINENFEKEEKVLALKKEYYKKLKGVIPAEKIVKLQGLEQEFKKEVLQRAKERRDNRPNHN